MLAAARHQSILSALRDRGVISASSLQKKLGVTAMTIWRDLKMLEELGLLQRVRGGASSMPRVAGEPLHEMKLLAARAAKQKIAAFAAKRFVRAGDALALGGGSTVAALVECLPSTKISVMTNSLPVALQVRSVRPEIPIRIAGGWLGNVSGNTRGTETLKAIEKWQAAVCFLSAAAFDEVVGPTDPNPLELEAQRSLAACARCVVMLLDSSKFNMRSNSITLHPRRLDFLVSDAPPPPDIRALLKANGVQFLRAQD